MTTLVPAFPSSGVTLSSFGDSPIQEGDFPALSAVENFGADAFGAVDFLLALAGCFAFFSCLAGSAAQVTPGLIAVRLSAKTPIAIVNLGTAALFITDLHVCAERVRSH